MSEYIVDTEYGKVQGYERDGIIEYLGIPYAKPPVGKLRFKRARKCDPYAGIFDAKEYGDPCIQKDMNGIRGSEDCLTVNVQRPISGGKLPVFVYIHGGGFSTGAASDGLLDGRRFAEDGLVFVSFQYRLNVLGFYDFSTYPGCGEFETNCGLSDQILAMQWIHRNIAAFGGDPENVTIDGESAGASSVVNMLAAPAVKGCFQKAIMQSALPNCVATSRHARENVDLFLEGMGWTESELSEKLWTVDAKDFLEGNDYMAKHHQEKNPGNFLPALVIDDQLPQRPLDAIKNGCAKDVKIIIGTNRHEGTMFVHPGDATETGFPNSWAMVREMFEKNGNADALGRIAQFYPGMEADAGLDDFVEFGTHYAFEMPSVKLACFQKAYTPDVWLYRYEFVSKSGEKNGMKASHAFDLPLSFANRTDGFSKFIYGEDDEADFDALVHAVHDAWVSFAKEGNPGADWKPFSGDAPSVRVINRESASCPFDRQEMLDAWGDLRFYEN